MAHVTISSWIVRASPFTRTLAVALLFTLAASATVSTLERANTLRASWPAEADLYYLPSSRTLALSSLGHHEMAADLVAARSNVYFGTQLGTRGAQRHLTKYVHTAADLDPYFHRVYEVGSAMLVYNGRRITADSVTAANEILERAIRYFPFDYQFRFQLGFNLLFELPKLVKDDDPRIAAWRQAGVESLQRAALFENVPYWLPNLVARMLTKSGSDEMAIRHLEQAYAVATTEQTRQQIYWKLKGLRSLQAAQHLEEERQRFDAMVNGRYTYPPDASFSVIAGPRRPRTVNSIRKLAQ